MLATPQPAAPREPTDAEIQKDYDRLFAAAVPAKEFHVRHVLVRTRETAVAALKEIKPGKPFAEVAANIYLDPGSREGRRLGMASAETVRNAASTQCVPQGPRSARK